MTANVQKTGRRQIGLGLATTLVIGNMIGSGVFLLPASLASYGGISLVGWAFTAAGAFLLAWVFASLARSSPKTGGPYAYSRQAFGDFIGFQTAWAYWIAAWLGNVAIAVAFVGYVGHFWNPLAGSTSSDHVLQAAVAAGAIWLLTAVNVRGVRQGSLVQGLTTVLKLVPLVAIAFVGIFWIHASHFSPFNASGGSSFSAVTAVGALTLWAFIGLESATIPAENVHDAKRNVPRATLIGTIVTAVVYILGTAAVLGVLPLHVLATSSAPFADAATQIWGGWAGDAVAVGAIIATFGCLNGWILLQGQMPYAAARDGLFPKEFARLNKHGAPATGIMASSVLLTLFMIPNYNASTVSRFTDFILLATTTTLIAYIYGAAARLMQLVHSVDRASTKRIIVELAVATLALAYAVWALYGAGYRSATWAMICVFAGIPIYAWLKGTATRQTIPEPAFSVLETPDVVAPDSELRDESKVLV
jgi:APA family basic amino acid/polyamine antiporter